MGNKILDINKLNVDFLTEGASINAVRDFSMHINENEIFGLVGESGCGKTTIGRTIIRLEEPTEGEMVYK